MMIMVPSKVQPPVAAGPRRVHPLADRLAGCWRLNEGAGPRVHDLSGYRQDGTFSGGPLWQAGPCGRAVEFDGDNDWISMGDCLNLGTDDITVLALVRYTAANQPDQWSGSYFGAIAGKGYLDGAGKGYGLLVYNNRISWQVRNQATLCEIHSDSVLNDGQWHMAVGVCDRDSSTGMRLYIDGIRQSTTGNPTAMNGVNLSGSQAFAVGSRQDTLGAWWADFAGRVAAVYVWKRVLTEPEIRQLQCEPFGLFARRRAPAAFAVPAGAVIDLAGSAAAVGSAGASLRVIRSLAGVAAAQTSAVGVLRRGGPAMLPDERPWLREALFHGVTAPAFAAGITLTQGRFWAGRSGCVAVYRGADARQVDLARVICMTGPDSQEISLPACLAHPAGSTHCYLVRRLNRGGRQERTTAAAVMVRLRSDGQRAPPAPNGVFGLAGAQIGGRRLRLRWFYCPLDQAIVPQAFNIFWDAAAGPVDLEHPLATIPYAGRRLYQYETDPLDEGRYRFVVRPCSSDQAYSMMLSSALCPVTCLAPEAGTVLAIDYG